MRKILIAVMVLIPLVCVACVKDEPAEKIEESEHGFKNYEMGSQLDQELGIIGEHQLYRIAEGVNPGRIQGNFFLGIGGIYQEPYAQAMHFAWQWQRNKIIFSAVPLSLVQFQLDNTKILPTVEFIFDEDWLRTSQNQALSLSEAQKRNPNELLDPDDKLELVIVRISEKDLQAHFVQSKPAP